MDDLRKNPVFKTLKQSDIDALFEISSVKRFGAGEIINYENDAIDKVYFLISGLVKAYKINRFDNEVFLYTMKSSGLITMFGFLESSIYFSNNECLESSTVLCIQFNQLQELVQKSHAINMFFYKELIKKMDILKYVISREIVFDGTAKVAYMLTNFTEEFNSLKKQDVAYMLNIQPETLSRILTKLKREDMIESSNEGDVTIKNRDRLVAIFMQ